MAEPNTVPAETIEIDPADSNSNSDDLEEPEELPQISTKVKDDMLFCVQNLGFVKTVDRAEIYAKREGCLDVLKELYKLLRNDNSDSHLRKVEVGRWNVIETDLANLIVNYPEDKNLTFYVLVLMVTLTDKPDRDHQTDPIYIDILQSYKTTFITRPQIMETLVKHIVYCLTIEESLKNDRHDQMLELVVYLIRNLVSIPDRVAGVAKGKKGYFMVNSREDHCADLQRRLLHILADSLSLEALIYLSQDFKKASIQKLNFCLLEIFFHILKHLKPEKLIGTAGTLPLTEMLAQDRAQQRAKMSTTSTRHSKFGSNYRESRQFAGVYNFKGACITSNAFALLLNRSYAPSQIQPVRPRLQDSLKSLPDLQNLSIEMDSELLKKMKKMCEDVLNQSYCSIVETVFAELYRDSDRLEAEDKVHYFVFQAFFLEFARRKYIAERKEPFDFDVACISESLKIQNFEYMFKCFVMELAKTTKKEYNAKEFQAALRFCLQFLYCVKEMSESHHEDIKKNAQILLQNIFFYEMSTICKKAFTYWKEGISRLSFLTEIVHFTHITYKLLEEYSKGKVLTVKTNRIVHKSRKRDEEEEYFSGDDSLDEDESIYKERQLNFTAEFSLLVDPEILLKYCILLRNLQSNSSFTNECIAKFLQRVMQDCQAEWLLFQIDYLREFYNVLEHRDNERLYPELYSTLRLVTKKFFALMQVNPLLPIESLFRFKDKNTVNDILSNYETVVDTHADTETYADMVDVENRLSGLEPISGIAWSREEDVLLLENYFTFKDMERVHEVLSDMLKDSKKTAKAVAARLKLLKVGKGAGIAREIMEELHYMDDIYSISRTAPRAFKVIGKDACLAALNSVKSLYREFRSEFAEGEFAWVPQTLSEFELLSKVEFAELLASIGFRMPGPGEWMVRVDVSLDAFDEVIGKLEAVTDQEQPAEASEDEVEYSANALDSFLQRGKPCASELPAEPLLLEPDDLPVVTHSLSEPTDPPELDHAPSAADPESIISTLAVRSEAEGDMSKSGKPSPEIDSNLGVLPISSL